RECTEHAERLAIAGEQIGRILADRWTERDERGAEVGIARARLRAILGGWLALRPRLRLRVLVARLALGGRWLRDRRLRDLAAQGDRAVHDERTRLAVRIDDKVADALELEP